MYGPAGSPPPPASTGDGRRLALRVVLAALPVFSLGLLAWVTLLVSALRRRRALDWTAFGIGLAMLAGIFVLVAENPPDGSTGSMLGGGLALLLMLGTPGWFLVAELSPARRIPAPVQPVHPAQPPAASAYGPPPAAWTPPAPAPAPGPRIARVQEELDELSAYLRNQQEGR